MKFLEQIAARWLRSRGWTVVKQLRYDPVADLRAIGDQINAALLSPPTRCTASEIACRGPNTFAHATQRTEGRHTVTRYGGETLGPFTGARVCFHPENWVMRPVGEPRQ